MQEQGTNTLVLLEMSSSSIKEDQPEHTEERPKINMQEQQKLLKCRFICRGWT